MSLMRAKRRSFEVGHRPKFLVLVDETPECGRAVRFAARRAARTGATLTMLSVVAPPEENFDFLGVRETMRAEAQEEAAVRLEDAAAEARSAAGVEPEQILREGDRAEIIVTLIDADPDISFLVLATGIDGEGPGPLVTAVISKAITTFSVPVVIVPGDLSDEEIDALAG